MATSVVPAVINYMVTTFTAANTLGAATPPVSIRLGPFLTQAFSQLTLWVGIDDPYGTQPGTPTGAVHDQVQVGMPSGWRDETASIFCCAEAWSGSTDTLTALNAAYGILAAAENVLRINVGLGDSTGRRWQFPGVTGGTLRWHQGEGGAAAQVLFRVDYKARIGASPGT